MIRTSLMLGIFLAQRQQYINAQTVKVSDGLINGGIIAVSFSPNVTFCFPKSTYIYCTWKRNLDAEITFYQFASCVNSTIINPNNITCFENSTTVVATYKPLPVAIPENLTLTLRCSSAPTPEFYLQGKYCPTKTSVVGPVISATTYTYNAPGQFVCPGGQELFYSNSTPGITNTLCQNDATWYGAEGLECWSEPLTHLKGTFTGTAGSSIHIQCTTDSSVYPSILHYAFFLGGKIIAQQNQTFILNVTREMNGKTIQCQAITKYTQIRADKGWSQPHTLNISYTPYLFSNYKCIGNEPCNITLSSNPSPHEANLMTGNESKQVTWIKQSNSTHVVQINEPAGNYKLLVSNSVGQTSLSVVISATNTNPPPGTNSALIIGISVTGVVVIGVVIFAVMAWMRKRKAKPGKDSVEFKKSEAVYVNTQVYENTEAQQNTSEYQNIHGTDNTGNVEKAHLYEVPITLHSKTDSG